MTTGRSPRHALGVSLATFALLLAGQPAAAQEAAPPPHLRADVEVRARQAPRADRARLGLFLRAECEIDGQSNRECSTSPVVTSVIEAAPAAEAGIQPGDTLIALNGLALRTESGRRALGGLQAGVPVRLQVGREGGRREIEVTPAPRPSAGLFDVNIERGAWWPRQSGEMRVFRFRDGDGGTAEFYFSPSPDAPPAPEGFVVFGEDEAGELRLETGRPGVALRMPDGRRIELAELARRADGEDRFNVEIEAVEGDADGVRHRVVLENAELAQRLEAVRRKVLEQARVRIDTLLRRQSELALRGDLPPAAAAGYLYRVHPDGSTEVRTGAPPAPHGGFRLSAIAPDHRLAGAEFRPLTPELAEYFPVEAGLLVLRVIPGTPAGELGLRGGDVVVEVGTHKVPDMNVFRRLVAEALMAGNPLEVKWNRKGTEMAGRLLSD
ncbi:MAG: PDZ domain-containing protein [Gemmatimonadota bacterium]|nr:PDZ domain-containing protein [Gemmatimonadota bacterium]